MVLPISTPSYNQCAPFVIALIGTIAKYPEVLIKTITKQLCSDAQIIYNSMHRLLANQRKKTSEAFSMSITVWLIKYFKMLPPHALGCESHKVNFENGGFEYKVECESIPSELKVIYSAQHMQILSRFSDSSLP